MAKGKHSADREYFREQYYEERNYYNNSNQKDKDSNVNTDSYDEEYYDKPLLSKTKVISAIILILIIICVSTFITKGGKNGKIEEVAVQNTLLSDNKLVSTYENYKVLGKIKINTIGVEQYILDSKEEKALENGIVKLYGNSLNSYGNLCLAGHNFENMLGKLNELKSGDEIILINPNLEETKYIVKEILTVDPTDLSALLSNEEKKELTLITCENASTKRLVVKALAEEMEVTNE